MNNTRTLRFRQTCLLGDFSSQFQRRNGESMRSYEQLSEEQLQQILDINNYFGIRDDINDYLIQLEDNLNYIREINQ